MKNLIVLLTLLVLAHKVNAHEGGHGVPLKEWTLNSPAMNLKADFIKYEEGNVWLSDEFHQIHEFKLSDFSAEDQHFILEKQQVILSLNDEKETDPWTSDSKIWLILAGSILTALSVYYYPRKKKNIHLAYGAAGLFLVFFVSCRKDNINSTKADGSVPANDITFMKSIFGSFAGVTTTADDTYFYVASNGLPAHSMMVGITNWQQQVPIEQNYTGSNSWAIPLKPELAENPLSTKTNLLKGAIAIAANGIPIFNPLNNRGEDANAIGELDQWGGHCGRADDYHYHLAPTHLQTTVGSGKPIAYAVDGFPVYGETSENLDQYLGKFNADGSYQYHISKEYPYLIAGMRGKVKLDPNTTAPENQVIPQAFTRGVRPATEPLRGAVITGFESVGENAYSLKYTLNSQIYTINYNWDANGKYTYQFVNPNGTTTQTYQR